jgi:DNA repair exonuclease SbcCD nuclease subunit
MAKILLFSDIHVHEHKNKQERLQNCLDALFWVFNTARERGIKDVVFGGDLFQDRQNISVFTYHQTYKIISQFKDLNLWFLLGNHDLWYYDKTDISSVEPLGALPHLTVIDQPTTIKIAGLDIDFLPFTHNPIVSMSDNFSQKKSPVLVGHIAVHGATLNFHHRTRSEVSVENEKGVVQVSKEIFDGYERVFLGHYHGAQQITERVEYIGSTLQLTFGEAFQTKHIIVLDTDTLKREYIENTFSPRHYILTPDQVDDYDLNGNFVRIAVEDAGLVDIMELRQKIAEQAPDAQIKIFEDKKLEADNSEFVQKFKITEGDTIERYVKTVGYGDLDETRLLEYGKDIITNEN